jgi:hypothetical protein
MFKRFFSVIPIVLAVLAMSYGLFSGSDEPGTLFAAAERQHEHESAQAPASPQLSGMMQMHQKMMADVAAAETKLDQLVNEMNSAAGDAKVAAIARVVTELANQQKAIHGQMGMMHEHMLGGRGMMMHK